MSTAGEFGRRGRIGDPSHSAETTFRSSCRLAASGSGTRYEVTEFSLLSRQLASGDVSLQGLSRRVVGLPVADGGHEVGERGGFQSFGSAVVRDVLERSALVIEEGAAGNTACEVAELTLPRSTAV